MSPGHKHFDQGIIDQALFFQHLQDKGTKDFSQGLQISLRHYKKIAALQEEPVSHQGMRMRMKPGIIANSVLLAVKDCIATTIPGIPLFLPWFLW